MEIFASKQATKRKMNRTNDIKFKNAEKHCHIRKNAEVVYAFER